MEIEMLDHAEISEYNPVEAGLQELRRKYSNVVVDVTTPKALEEAKRVRAEIREPRYECEKIRKTLKAPALAHAKLIDTEAARITAELLAIETPWDDAIKAEELRKEVEKEAKAAAERARIMAINERIAELRGYVNLALECRTSERIGTLIEKLTAQAITPELYQEFETEAVVVKEAALMRLGEIHAAKKADEDERARVKAEQEAAAETLRKEREALEQAQAEAKRVADEAAAKVQAAAEEMAAQRAAFEAEQEAHRQAMAAETLRIAADRAALDVAKDPDAKAVAEYAAAISAPNPAIATMDIAQAAIESVAQTEESEVLVLTGEMLSIPMGPAHPPVDELIAAVANKFNVPMFLAAEWLVNAADEIAEYQ